MLTPRSPVFSICVPNYNSLDYLQELHRSLKTYTKLKYELIVHENGSEDNYKTVNWLQKNNIQFSYSEKNEGYCGVNHAIKLASTPYVMLFNTDMMVLPGWDTAIFEQIEKFKSQNIEKFTISSCLIEPYGNNPEYYILPTDMGKYIVDQRPYYDFYLLQYFQSNKKQIINHRKNTIQYSHPILLPKKMLEEMNYLDPDYYPGWSSDHDLAKRAYEVGCRNFIMLSNSRVFHFISKTFSQLPSHIKNMHGQDIFEKKWGISVEQFRKQLQIATPFKEVE